MEELRKLKPRVDAVLQLVDELWEGLSRGESFHRRTDAVLRPSSKGPAKADGGSQAGIRFVPLPIDALSLPLLAATPDPSLRAQLAARQKARGFQPPRRVPSPSLLTALPPRLANAVEPTPVAPAPLPTPAGAAPVQTQDTDEAESEDGDGAVPSTGPVFMGQVFTMCDSSRRGLIAVNNIERMPPIHRIPVLPPFFKRLLVNLADRGLLPFVGKGGDGPIFHFFFDKDNAADYVKRVQSERFGSPELAESVVGSCPLESAYGYFKEKPSMFRFVPDEKQVKVARQLLRKEMGRKAAKEFSGVPVFTARNLTIAMSTGSGIRWFTPYFFDKQQLDSLIGHSVDHYYQMLMQARRVQRHAEPVQANFPPTDADGEDPDSLLDPPEMGEFMEEMGQGGVPLESVLLRAAEVQVHDMVDSAFLGNRWGRRLLGLQPVFPVLVDSFERRAAAAEVDASKHHAELHVRVADFGAGALPDGRDESGGGRAVNPPEPNTSNPGPGKQPEEAPPSTAAATAWTSEPGSRSSQDRLKDGGGGRPVDSLEGGGRSELRASEAEPGVGGKGRRDMREGEDAHGRANVAGEGGGVQAGNAAEKKKSGDAHARGDVSEKSPATFDFADWGWDFNSRGDEERRAGGGSSEGEEKDGSSRPTAQNAQSEGKEKTAEDEPHLTWLGASVFASPEQKSDAALQKAIMQVAKDMEDRMVKGKLGGEELGPLFIADLGDPNSFWGVNGGQSGSVWEEEESE